MPEGTAQARTDPAHWRPVVVMGVAGCGKTVVGEGLATALGWRFIEGDRLHPQANVERMSAGLPLTDAHRWSWLDAIGMQIAEAGRDGVGSVAACSALKRVYRDGLRSHDGRILFIYLDIDKATAAARVAARKGHFMPASLIDSQFADLEPPGPGEAAIRLDARRPVGDLVAEAADVLRTV
ncbi:gluconokinase [Mesorhizobium sp. BAC0120]|uniref:gluconokinase n=1 Tax=Mesorhizobium sp. BAC0120 TaxID=3090670 RepID=UPI00298CAAAC|nr:gluconokinase [Mesorhizobium sp. BAC0120]MDW6020597.1 gluconokinase [Mesorhizobium sp. BAC0120]